MSASDDTIEYTYWQVYAGESLHGTTEEPIDILLDPETMYGLERGIPAYWQVVLAVIQMDLKRRSQ